MNLIDVFLLGVILVSAWRGWHKGFVLGLLELLSWISSLFLGFLLYPHIAVFLDKYLASFGLWSLSISFLLAIILARLGIGVVINWILSATPTNLHYHFVNKFFGVAPGLINGLVYAALIATLFLFIPFSETLSTTTQQSTIAGQLTGKVQWLESKLSPIIKNPGGVSSNKITIVPESEKFITLPYKVSKLKVRPDLESKMLDMVNSERKKKGLKLLKADPELAEVARKHSRDMFTRGYFSHYTIEKKDPFDRMRDAQVVFTTAGENLALAQNLSMAHTGLMNSPGHRANILQGAFGRVGIGILDGGIYGIMITQNFRN
jgi:uncharacterized protein YkwD